MSRFDHIWQHYFPNRQSPEEYVERYLIRVERLDQKKFAFWREYQAYLASQRELLLDDISEALLKASSRNLELPGYRIVTSNYGDDPLCTYGSIVDAGRFNFGSISEVFKDFDCLYIGDSPATCYSEKFHYLEEQTLNEDLTGAEAALIPSHQTVRISLKLESYLDLRQKDSLHDFLVVVSKIKSSAEYQKKWIKLHKKSKDKPRPLNTISKLDQLIISIFDPSFKQANSLMDLPSNSQWLGHYTRMAGIQGIVYPSVRKENGFNVAIFPSNIEDTEAFVSLTDKIPYVPVNRRSMTAENCHFFRFSQKKLKEFEKSLKN